MQRLLANARLVKVGERFGRLTIIGVPFFCCLVGTRKKRHVVARCDCGKIRCFSVSSLERLAGPTRSCGCKQREAASTSGGVSSKYPVLFHAWNGMVQRCCNPKNRAYRRYGGRGIVICDEWRNDPTAFIQWSLANGHAPGLTIDRKDNEQGYSPENCRWVTAKENNRNRSSNLIIEIFGERKCLAEWAEDPRCLPRLSSLQERIAKGWSPELALTTPRLPPGPRPRRVKA